MEHNSSSYFAFFTPLSVRQKAAEGRNYFTRESRTYLKLEVDRKTHLAVCEDRWDTEVRRVVVRVDAKHIRVIQHIERFSREVEPPGITVGNKLQPRAYLHSRSRRPIDKPQNKITPAAKTMHTATP
jgi:hypothetical protein